MNQQESPSMMGKLDRWFQEANTSFSPEFQAIRKEALKGFRALGFPHHKMEKWRNTDLSNSLQYDYELYTKEFSPQQVQDDLLQCEIHDLNAFTVNLYRGRYVYNNEAIF
jgi:hypothetical protein